MKEIQNKWKNTFKGWIIDPAEVYWSTLFICKYISFVKLKLCRSIHQCYCSFIALLICWRIVDDEESERRAKQVFWGDQQKWFFNLVLHHSESSAMFSFTGSTNLLSLKLLHHFHQTLRLGACVCLFSPQIQILP